MGAIRKICAVVLAGLLCMAALLIWQRYGNRISKTDFIADFDMDYSDNESLAATALNIDETDTPATQKTDSSALSHSFYTKLADAAHARTRERVRYVRAYVSIDYPGGDVPANTGVCTDVVIRSYRKMGIDLQVKVHQDMKQNFHLYPNIWGLKKPDTNIDHRRVPNLMVFFSRFGKTLPKSKNGSDYQPGDIVCWDLGRGMTHIAIVANKKGPSGNYMIIHNIGAGPKMDDRLFAWKIIGHFKYQ